MSFPLIFTCRSSGAVAKQFAQISQGVLWPIIIIISIAIAIFVAVVLVVVIAAAVSGQM